MDIDQRSCRVLGLEGHVAHGPRTGSLTGTEVVEFGEVDRSGNKVFWGSLKINSGVVLVASALGRNHELNILKIGDSIKATTDILHRCAIGSGASRENTQLR